MIVLYTTEREYPWGTLRSTNASKTKVILEEKGLAYQVERLRPGVLNSLESAETDSFSSSLLDGPHYTRPREYRGMDVPGVLLSGDHGAIAKWRQEQRERQTRERRPDIWQKFLADQGQ